MIEHGVDTMLGSLKQILRQFRQKTWQKKEEKNLLQPQDEKEKV